MEILKKFARGSAQGAGFAFAVLAIGMGIAYGAAAWGALPNATTGTQLSTTAWNDIVSQVNGLAGAMAVSSGKVGVWTSSPLAKLHVSAPGNDTVSVANSVAYFRGSTQGFGIAVGGRQTSPLSAWIQGFTNDSTADMPIALNPNWWNVGIGVASPAAKLDVGGRIRTTGNVYWSECGGRYLCSPMACYNLCKANGDRMASQEEVYTLALRGNDSCAYGWYYYLNQADGTIHYASWYPMGSASLPGCGNGVAWTPRLIGPLANDTVDLNSANRADCYCSGL